MALKRLMAGLYEGEELRLESLGPYKPWRAQAKMQQIGTNTNYYEPNPNGVWMDIGTFSTRAKCELAHQMLKSGNYVFQPAHSTSSGRHASAIFLWVNVKDEIARLLGVEGVPEKTSDL